MTITVNVMCVSFLWTSLSGSRLCYSSKEKQAQSKQWLCFYLTGIQNLELMESGLKCIFLYNSQGFQFHFPEKTIEPSHLVVWCVAGLIKTETKLNTKLKFGMVLSLVTINLPKKSSFHSSVK